MSAPTVTSAEPPGTRRMEVANTRLLVRLLADAAGPLDFLREFTQNAIEAIRDDIPGSAGTVLWDVDWGTLARTHGAECRLSIIDTGPGMPMEALTDRIGALFSSGKQQSENANFGIGSTVAGARFSPAGVEYRTWHQGVGMMMILHTDASGEWGPKKLREGLADPECYLQPLSDNDRPPLLASPAPIDGTAVTFVGLAAGKNTYDPPADADGREAWIRRYLNERYFTLPATINVVVRENVVVTPATDIADAGWTNGTTQRVTGSSALLDAHSEHAGTLQLSDALCRWWVLPPRPTKRRRRETTREWSSVGFTGLLFNGEVYDCPRASSGGYNRLMTVFKIRSGYERVVILIEPPPNRVTSDASRVHLQIDGQSTHEVWTRWGAEFVRVMPEPIAELQQSLLVSVDAQARRSKVREHWIKHTRPYIERLTAYARKRPRGPAVNDDTRADRDSGSAVAPTAEDTHVKGSDAGARASAVAPRAVPRMMYPKEIVWLPLDAEVPAHLENRAAHWGGKRDDVLTINPQFAMYRTFVDGLMDTFASPDNDTGEDVGVIIGEMVHLIWVTSLASAIDAARRLGHDDNDIAQLTSPEALSGVVLNLAPLSQELRRTIAIRLGAIQRAPSPERDDDSDGDASLAA